MESKGNIFEDVVKKTEEERLENLPEHFHLDVVGA